MNSEGAQSVGDAIREAAGRLAETSDTARLDAELLMAHALGQSRSDMLVRSMRDAAVQEFAALVERRAGHEPVAYIIGQQEFYGHDFRVTRDTLIPRPDSEVLVEAALALRPEARRVLDLGTGTGALLLSVLAHTDATGIGTDKSAAALKVAADNADRLGLAARAQFRLLDWNAEEWTKDIGPFEVILCNPPYIELGASLDPDVERFEPHGALFAGEEGLTDYRAILPCLRDVLAKNGVAIFEIGYQQAEAVTALAAREGFAVEVRRDLADRPRALVLT